MASTNIRTPNMDGSNQELYKNIDFPQDKREIRKVQY